MSIRTEEVKKGDKDKNIEEVWYVEKNKYTVQFDKQVIVREDGHVVEFIQYYKVLKLELLK
jgi:hypothetical protein